MIKGIEEFGKVEKCEEVNGEYHIKITDGFSGKAMNTFRLMKFINEAIGDKYPNISKCVTDDNLYDCVLKP